MYSKKGNAIVWILVILVLAGLVWWIAASRGNNNGTATTTVDMTLPATTTDMTSTTTGMNGGDASASAAAASPTVVTVNYTASGFVPKTVTIHEGDTVRWVDQTSNPMWIASANHPTHTVYDGTSLSQHCGTPTATAPFDQCGNGTTYSFTFDKAGTWGYHNHMHASDFGSVIVQ